MSLGVGVILYVSVFNVFNVIYNSIILLAELV